MDVKEDGMGLGGEEKVRMREQASERGKSYKAVSEGETTEKNHSLRITDWKANKEKIERQKLKRRRRKVVSWNQEVEEG